MLQPPQPGDPAPDFALPPAPGAAPVRLSDHRGRGPVVLLFFPLAWSRACTRELCTVRDDHASYLALGTRVLGISVDSPFALAEWGRQERFGFPLLSDFNRDVSRAYGAIYDDFFGLQGVSKRASFIIDEEGVVRYREVLEDADRQPDFAAIQQSLRALVERSAC